MPSSSNHPLHILYIFLCAMVFISESCQKLDDACEIMKSKSTGDFVYLDSSEYRHYIMSHSRKFHAIVKYQDPKYTESNIGWNWIGTQPSLCDKMKRMARSVQYIGMRREDSSDELIFVQRNAVVGPNPIYFFLPVEFKYNDKRLHAHMIQDQTLENLLDTIHTETGLRVITTAEMPLLAQTVLGALVALVFFLNNCRMDTSQVERGFTAPILLRSVVISFMAHLVLSTATNRFFLMKDMEQTLASNLLSTGTSAFLTMMLYKIPFKVQNMSYGFWYSMGLLFGVICLLRQHSKLSEGAAFIGLLVYTTIVNHPCDKITTKYSPQYGLNISIVGLAVVIPVFCNRQGYPEFLFQLLPGALVFLAVSGILPHYLYGCNLAKPNAIKFIWENRTYHAHISHETAYGMMYLEKVKDLTPKKDKDPTTPYWTERVFE